MEPGGSKKPAQEKKDEWAKAMLTTIGCIQSSRNESQEGLVLPKMYPFLQNLE